jgi:type III pantothenate kinase
MFLAIDIGNTNITLGVYEGERLCATWRAATVHDRMTDEYGIMLLQLMAHRGISPKDITGAAIASVVPALTGVFRRVCADYVNREALVVDTGVKTGVRIRYENPREVGADRVVDCAAVQAKYGGPACVVDFGTATTFDAITREGDYLGGAIAPGIGIAAEALFSRASKLYRVEIAAPQRAIGLNTSAALQSGIFFGYVGLVEGLVARFRRELGDDMKVIATGGLAEVVARETAVIQHVDPWLTLDGLRLVYEMNRK